MKMILNILVAIVLAQKSSCTFTRLAPHGGTDSLTASTTELLSSYKNCIVYIFDWAREGHHDSWVYNTDYDSVASTHYIRFYSENINCAVFVESLRQHPKSALNQRFRGFRPHPLFTKYTTTLLNLYTPHTTSAILEKVNMIQIFYEVMALYNIAFNYIMIFMRSDEFSSIDNVGLFRKLATVSSPAAHLLILDEEDVFVIGFANAFQEAPFLFTVVKVEEASIQQLYEIIHKDMQGAISRVLSPDRSWERCGFGALISSHPHYCALEGIAENFNITFLNNRDHYKPQLSINEITVKQTLSPDLIQRLSRMGAFNLNFVSYAVQYKEYNFLCISKLSTAGLMTFVQAFDLFTWIAAATACLCLSAAIAAMATKTRVSLWTTFKSSLPVVLLLLIERFYRYGRLIRSASRQIGLAITLWAFGAMVLGMCFNGNMIGELTSPSLPSCPHDMEQLTKIEGYPILTDAEVYREGVRRPYFGFRIDEYLAEHGNKHGSLPTVLRQFGKKLTFVHENSSQLIPSIDDTSSKISSAYVGLQQHVRAYGMWSMAQSKKIRGLPGGNLPFFNVQVPLLVQSNFLGPILQRFLGSLCQCGLWKYWSDGSDGMDVRVKLVRLVLRAERESVIRQWLRTPKMFDAIWHNFNTYSVEGESSRNGRTLENLNAAFQVFGVCMLLAGCVFMKEIRILRLLRDYLR